MKLGIINSAFDQAGVDTKTGLEHIARIGFDSVDIFTEAMTIEQAEIDLIKRTCDDNDLPIVSTVVVSAGLVDFNDPVRDYHVERANRFVDLGQTLNSNNLLLVLGEYIWQREVIPPEAQWEWGVEGVRKIGDYAGERGMEIALELEPFRLSLLNSVPKMAQFIDDCGLPNVRPILISVISSWRIPLPMLSSFSRERRLMCISVTVTARCMGTFLPGGELSNLLLTCKRSRTLSLMEQSRWSWSIHRIPKKSLSGLRKHTTPRTASWRKLGYEVSSSRDRVSCWKKFLIASSRYVRRR